MVIEQLTCQLRSACSGVAKRVTSLQTESGVKDAYTQYFIDDLIKEARQLRDSRPEWTIDTVQQFLWAKYEPKLNEMLSPFLTLVGMSLYSMSP